MYRRLLCAAWGCLTRLRVQSCCFCLASKLTPSWLLYVRRFSVGHRRLTKTLARNLLCCQKVVRPRELRQRGKPQKEREKPRVTFTDLDLQTYLVQQRPAHVHAIRTLRARDCQPVSDSCAYRKRCASIVAATRNQLATATPISSHPRASPTVDVSRPNYIGVVVRFIFCLSVGLSANSSRFTPGNTNNSIHPLSPLPSPPRSTPTHGEMAA